MQLTDVASIPGLPGLDHIIKHQKSFLASWIVSVPRCQPSAKKRADIRWVVAGGMSVQEVARGTPRRVGCVIQMINPNRAQTAPPPKTAVGAPHTWAILPPGRVPSGIRPNVII